ncbi:hypothetical protein, partial [Flavihumibacter sp. CACIAM 22H1]|uniref:hypothetical protein n=1 Tax=Flavihumibacter sp. CACIAM 22H1 TaxID=1812911 RepID=UPI0025BA394D
MNEQQKWQDWKPEDEDLDKLLLPGRIQQFQPQHPLLKLKKGLQMNIISGLVILVFYLAILWLFPYWQISLAMLITISFTVYVLWTAWKLYRSIQSTVSATRPVLQELKQHLGEITKWGRVQQQLGLFVYPFAAAGGYLCG